MKLMLIFGTRPEAIKMAPVIKELKKAKGKFKPIVCVTAQHRQMLDQVLRVFGIRPDYDLKIMQPGQSLFEISANCLVTLKAVLEKEKPDFVIAQGDTTSAVMSALAAFYCRIPVAHIEAGLRTYNKYCPFPEEVNRHLLSVISDINFAPTRWAKENLLKEGISSNKIVVTGNTVVDALLEIKKRQRSLSSENIWKGYFKKRFALDVPMAGKKIILVTGHRRESFGEGFKNICSALKEMALNRQDVFIIYPVHLNPNVQKPVKRILGKVANVKLIEPLEYEPFIYLMDKSYLILTDSGGIQEEAPSLGKPVLVMRDTTERPEGVDAGVVKLVGANKVNIIKETVCLLDNKKVYSRMSKACNPYGDGMAARRIIGFFRKLSIKQPCQ